MEDQISGIKIETLKIAPKGTVYFVDPETAKKWKEHDKTFKRKWWSPRAWFKNRQIMKTVNREAKAIIKDLPKSRVRPWLP